MSLLSYIFPRIILKTSSSYNREIRVLEEAGQYKLLVNGSWQSGTYIAMLWRKAFQKFGIPSLLVSRILVLGVGGGTVFGILKRLFPQAAMTGVDIDPTILDIAEKYFGLADMPGLTLIHDDAQGFVHKTREHYDLVIVDLFFGGVIPEFVTKEPFLGDLRRITSPHGSIVINYLRELEYQDKSDRFMKLLGKKFPHVVDFPIERNRFFFVSVT